VGPASSTSVSMPPVSMPHVVILSPESVS